ncbi:recombinase family protein [Sutcliffiella horikoshii]
MARIHSKKHFKQSTYCGDLVQNRTETVSVTTTKRRVLGEDEVITHENTHEPIIAKDTFQACCKQEHGPVQPLKSICSQMFCSVKIVKRECGSKLIKKVIGVVVILNTEMLSAKVE